jgi:hypothetical protein
MIALMAIRETIELAQLNTYFLFPFSIDKITVVENHQDVWAKYTHWIDGLDEWIAEHRSEKNSGVVVHLGKWRRDPYARFDLESAAYQDMMFFHPYVRRVFFDIGDSQVIGEQKEALLRCYNIPIDGGRRLWFQAEDTKGRLATVEITDLRLFLFANGVGILSIGVEAQNVRASDALWINEAFRKVYPTSGRQVREGRIPSRMQLILEQNGNQSVLAQEEFKKGGMIGYLPPLARTITSMIYFSDYSKQEFEPALDERMYVYSYACVNPDSVPEGFMHSEAYQVFLSRFLYVDLDGPTFRYDADFTRSLLSQQLYRRWAHLGTYYGFSSYSGITSTVGAFEYDGHTLHEGFLIHRMFRTRYYLMQIISLFYRATLLDFAERTALVSKRIFRDWEDGKLTKGNVRLASDLRAEFLHFSNYWYFDELANKDEEFEHFALQCRAMRIEPVKKEVEEEIEKLNTLLQSYAASRNTEAVNRLAMLSLFVGAGAVLTGFFGMNFGRTFGRLFFEPDASTLVYHYAAVAVITFFVLAVIASGLYLVISNWSDYRDVFRLRGRLRAGEQVESSLKRGPSQWSDEDE